MSLWLRHSVLVYIQFLYMRMIQLTLHHGLSLISATGFGIHAMILCLLGGASSEDGYQYGKLAIRLLERFDVKAWVPRVFLAVCGLANLIVMPLRNSIEPLMDAHRIGLASGVTECAIDWTATHMHMLFRFHGSESKYWKSTAAKCQISQSICFLQPNSLSF
jgi:predicted ATPase